MKEKGLRRRQGSAPSVISLRKLLTESEEPKLTATKILGDILGSGSESPTIPGLENYSRDIEKVAYATAYRKMHQSLTEKLGFDGTSSSESEEVISTISQLYAKARTEPYLKDLPIKQEETIFLNNEAKPEGPKPTPGIEAYQNETARETYYAAYHKMSSLLKGKFDFTHKLPPEAEDAISKASQLYASKRTEPFKTMPPKELDFSRDDIITLHILNRLVPDEQKQAVKTLVAEILEQGELLIAKKDLLRIPRGNNLADQLFGRTRTAKRIQIAGEYGTPLTRPGSQELDINFRGVTDIPEVDLEEIAMDFRHLLFTRDSRHPTLPFVVNPISSPSSFPSETIRIDGFTISPNESWIDAFNKIKALWDQEEKWNKPPKPLN